MSYSPRILAFAGSLRRDSYNKKLVRIAAEGAREAGAEVTYLDLRELDLPIYDGDLEQQNGLPPGARKLKDLMIASDGFLIASPEYNSAITAALKNAIDWASRPMPNEKPLEAFTGKVAGVMAASTGALGGLRGLPILRVILSNIGVLVLPDQIGIIKAAEAFAEDGSLKDEAQQAKVKSIAAKVTETIRKLKS